MNEQPYTNRESLKLLGQSLLNRLENRKHIEFQAGQRTALRDEIYRMLSPYVLTEEDLTDKTRATVEATQEQHEAVAASNTQKHQAAKKVLRDRFGNDVLNGFYFQKPLHELSKILSKFFMDSKLIEEVYASDEEIQKELIEGFQKFNPDHLH